MDDIPNRTPPPMPEKNNVDGINLSHHRTWREIWRSITSPQHRLRLERGLFITLALIIMGVSFGIVSNIETREKAGIAKSLETALHTSHAGIISQMDDQKKSALVWAKSDQIHTAAIELDRLPRTPNALINSLAQKNLRMWITTLVRTVGYRGYFLIGKDNVNLASSRDENVGVKSLLPDQFLDQVWKGQTRISLPQISQVPLKDESGKLVSGLPTMFVATPIFGPANKVQAILAFRINPDESFTPIFERGRYGKSGDTYAFNKNGFLISESHFNKTFETFKKITHAQSTLAIKLRDPGVNLLLGEKSPLPREAQPLTLMAKSATAGKSGINTDGYRNYRGVTVVGAWVWDQQLGFGFATSIDTQEAFATFYEIRLVIYAFTILSIGTLVILATVHDRSRREIAVREERYRQSLQYTHTGTWDWDIQKDILFWSDILTPLFGFKPGTTKTPYQAFLNVIHPNDRQAVIDAMQACVDLGAKYDIEHRVIWPDGSVHWIREKGDVKRQADGTPLHMLGIANNIDKRKEAEETLRKLSRALEQSPNAVFITDTEGLIEYVNPHFTTLMGYTAQEAIGKNPRILKSKETPKDVHTALWTTIQAGKEWRGEIRNECKNGSHFWAYATVAPVKDDTGKTTHYIATHEDISQRKDAEFAMQTALKQADVANRAKSELLANMSHELRTPLNAIIGFSTTIKEETFGPLNNDKYKEYIDDICGSGQHLLNLIKDVLDVSVIESGKLELDEDTLDINELIKSSIRLVKTRAQEEEVKLHLNITPNLPLLFADERRVIQALVNILSNAVKFTRSGGHVTISVSLDDQKRFIFTVTDTGVGMDKKELAKAMTQFGQVSRGHVAKHEGTGLGLPLTEGLIELHGGTLTITSQKAAGTTVEITFPQERTVPTAEHKKIGKGPDPKKKGLYT